MSRISIKQQIILLVALLTAGLLAIGWIGVKGMADAEHALNTVYEDRVVPMGLLKDVNDQYAIRIVRLAFKAQHDELPWSQALVQVEQAETQAKNKWAAYTRTSLLGDEVKLVGETKPLFLQVDHVLARLREILRGHDHAALQRFRDKELYAVLDQLAAKINLLTNLQQDEVNAEHQKNEIETAAAKILFMGAAVVTLVFSLAFASLMLHSLNSTLVRMMDKTRQLAAGDLSVRIEVVADNELGRLARAFNQMADNLQELVSNVQRSGIQLASSATEIAASVKEQQATATEQSATTTQIVVSTKEIASTSRVLVKNMDEVAHVADSTSALAEGGREDLARMEATMNQMMEATRGIASRLAVLSEKAGNINTVVTTINKVADQTNLLSLNAAIEAEKAGEHGIGFGVVATEIRRLADQTAVATWDIEQMVKEMQSAVSSGVMGMEKFSEEVRHGVEQVGQVGERLSKIVKSVQLLTPHFESVYEAMQVQSTGSEQINHALEQLSQTVQGTAEAMRESALVVDQLNEASHRLQSAVSKFKVAA